MLDEKDIVSPTRLLIANRSIAIQEHHEINQPNLIFKMSVHPRPQAWFETNVPNVAEFITRIKAEIDAGKRHILVKAPVKSGKRLMVEFLSVFLPGCPVKYVTSLNRKDVKKQKDELERYGIDTYVLSDAEKCRECIEGVRSHLRRSPFVVCCFDECDYGSGDRQIMSSFYEAFIDEPNVVKVYFSATAHETAASDVSCRANYVAMTYVPPASYCGASYFLANDLVFNPQPFFENVLGRVEVTEHAKQVLRASITDERHIAVVRTTRAIPTALFKNPVVREEIEGQLLKARPGKPWKIVPVDQKDSHDWEDRVIRIGYTCDTEFNYLFVILQTCTRGTDLKGWHRNLAFWHDERASENVNLNTMIQAVLRPCHYSSDYEGVPQPVRLYVDRRVVQMAADDDMEAYLAAGGKEPARTKAVSPGRQALGWAKPIRFRIPARLRTEQHIENYYKPNANDDIREWWMSRLETLLSEENLALLAGRTMKGKRLNTGIFTVHRAYVENRASRPGGGNTNMDEIRQDHFWLDIATEEHEGIPVGTAYITYGIPERNAELLRTKPASMYESRRGDL